MLSGDSDIYMLTSLLEYFLFAVRFQKLLRKLLGRFICLGVPVSCSLPPSASAGAGVYSRKQPKLGKRKAEYVEALFYINAKLINCRIWNHDPRPVDIEPLHPELGSPSSIPTGLAGIQCPRRKAVLRFLGRNAKRTGVGLCEYHMYTFSIRQEGQGANPQEKSASVTPDPC